MNPAKRALARTQKFVVDHKVAIAVTATAVITAVVVKKATSNAYKIAHDFINEKGLAEEFGDYLLPKE